MDILRNNDSEMIDEGVSLDTITQQLSETSLHQTIDALQELQNESIIYTTYDDDHFKIL